MTNAHLRPEFLLTGSRTNDGRYMLIASATLTSVVLDWAQDLGLRDRYASFLEYEPIPGSQRTHLEAHMHDVFIVYGDSYADCVAKLFGDPAWQAAQERHEVTVSHEPVSSAALDSIRQTTSHALGPGRSLQLDGEDFG